jgi:hypothetical protein
MGDDASATMFGSRCRVVDCPCWVVFVIFSEAKKELVLECWGGLAGKLALTGLILRSALLTFTLRFQILSKHNF